jgi:hypothetical protein
VRNDITYSPVSLVKKHSGHKKNEKEIATMNTITESAVQTGGASLQVELSNSTDIATPVVALLCPDGTVVAQASVYKTQLRGYNN